MNGDCWPAAWRGNLGGGRCGRADIRHGGRRNGLAGGPALFAACQPLAGRR